jgi:cell division protein FtsZ
MSIKLDIPKPETLKPKIAIFGVGGAGGNALNNMILSKLEGVEFIAANTDAQAISHSLALPENRIQLGIGTTGGLGAGSFPDKGKAAAEENIEEIAKYLDGCNMVFIAAGMGGGTGTGAAPVIAKLARERDILTVGVVTKPFAFEGKYRSEIADQGIEELKKYVDTLIVIPNQNLFRIANESTTFEAAFKMADDVLHAGVRGITDLITMPGLVNLDFAYIRTIMTKMGKAMMGTGEAAGENRAIKACEMAISNPLLDDISIKGAKGVLVNMTGGPDMTLFEADNAVNAIRKEVDVNANIIFGTAFNDNMKGKIRISVVATGIDQDFVKKEQHKTTVDNDSNKFRASVINSVTQSAKNFFDPGVASKPKQKEITEITDQNFQTKKSTSSQDFNNLQAESVKVSQAVEQQEFDDIQEEDFVIDTATSYQPAVVQQSKTSEAKAVASTSQTANQAKPIQAKAPIKKDGFSLFSFMNKDEEKSQQDKKNQQFFGTILDEDDAQDEAKFSDDIINIPAFFRRNKK